MSDSIVRLIGSIRAGFPSPAEDYLEEEINLEKFLRPNPASSFLARVVGDSMRDAGIPDNAIIVIDKAIRAKPNDIIVAVLNGEFTLKYLVVNRDKITLAPANPNYPIIPIEEGMQFSVWGVVTKAIVDLARPGK